MYAEGCVLFLSLSPSHTRSCSRTLRARELHHLQSHRNLRDIGMREGLRSCSHDSLVSDTLKWKISPRISLVSFCIFICGHLNILRARARVTHPGQINSQNVLKRSSHNCCSSVQSLAIVKRQRFFPSSFPIYSLSHSRCVQSA